MATTSPDRIVSLDIIRGIAVMGILSVNIVGMGMIEQAYFYPPDFGFDTIGDRVMWAANFIVVDGRLRSLFSILFGASMVLVIERAVAAGKKGWKVHYARMFVLLLFGLAHFYFLWWGDILANYAMVGMVAFLFWRLPVKWLVPAALVALALMYVPNIYGGMQQVAEVEAKRGPGATPEQRQWVEGMLAEMEAGPSAEALAKDNEAHSTIVAHFETTLETQPFRPFMSIPGYGLETLGLMLLGMAGYKSGFLTASWSRRRYWQVAAVFAGGSLLAHAYAAYATIQADFAPWVYFPWTRMYLMPLHAIAAFGYAALIILLISQTSAIGERVAAVGRAAFTNYLGATIVGVLLFYDHGLNLYGQLSRGELWLLVPPIWALMLLWSQPWLQRFRYGPFEWAWRCLSRWRWEPMREMPQVVEPAAA